MSIKTESAKLKELKDQSVSLIKKIIAKKFTDDSEGGGGGGGEGGGGGGTGGGKDGLDGAKKGVSGPSITGKGNFDDLILFLTIKAPIDPTIKTKLGDVYKLINNIPLTSSSAPAAPAPAPAPAPAAPAPAGPAPTGPISSEIKKKITTIAKSLSELIKKFNDINEGKLDSLDISSDKLAIDSIKEGVKELVNKFEKSLIAYGVPDFNSEKSEFNINDILDKEFTQWTNFQIQPYLIRIATKVVNKLYRL